MRPNKNNGGLLLKLLVVLGLLAAAGIAVYRSLQVTVQVAVVRRDDPVDAVTGSVRVDADGGIKELKSKAAGEVVWCEAIDPGHKFKQGDPLVKLETKELQRQIDEAQRKYDSDKARAKLILENNPERKVAQETLDNLKRLRDLGNMSEDQVKAAQRALDAIDTRLKVTEFDDKKGEADFKAAMEDMKLQLEKMTIRAPFDGEVEGALTWNGALITAGQPVARIFSNVRVVAAKISEENFGRVRLGQTAKLRLLTYGSESFDATVSKLLPTADETQRFTVYLDVKVDPVRLKPGSTGETTITVDRRTNQLVIPRRALFNGNQVFVAADGRIEQRQLELGFVALNVVEVRAGLKDGELVIVENQDQLRPGKRVRTQQVN
jgi:RND family efflux transporter MFP subunit